MKSFEDREKGFGYYHVGYEAAKRAGSACGQVVPQDCPDILQATSLTLGCVNAPGGTATAAALKMQDPAKKDWKMAGKTGSAQVYSGDRAKRARHDGKRLVAFRDLSQEQELPGTRVGRAQKKNSSRPPFRRQRD